MDITDILTIINGERFGDENRNNMASTTQNDCHNYSIAGTSECQSDIADIILYVNIEAFDPIEYVENSESMETGSGEEVTLRMQIRPRVRFTITGNQMLVNYLNQLRFHETIIFTNLVDSVDAVVSSMEVTHQLADDYLRIEVALLMEDSAIERTLCCGSYYENAPFNECDGEGETGDPNNDPDCEGYAVTITLVAGEPDELTASTELGGDGDETFTWYLDGELFGSGPTIQPVLPGVYRVDAVKGNCTDSIEYTYSGDCGGFAVTIDEVVTDDGDSILIALPNLVSTFQWQVFNDPDWEDLAGADDVYLIPTEDGEYRVVASTTGGCEAISDSVEVDIPPVCGDMFSLTIANNDGDLEVTIVDYAGEDTPTYEWYLDDGAGLMALPGEVTNTIADATAGYYKIVVIINGCSQSTGLLVQCEPVSGGSGDMGCPTNNFQKFEGDDVSVAFNVTNFTLIDPAFWTDEEIESALMVDRQGLKLRYNPAPTMINEYSIDYATQEIRLAAAFPLDTGDTLGALNLNR